MTEINSLFFYDFCDPYEEDSVSTVNILIFYFFNFPFFFILTYQLLNKNQIGSFKADQKKTIDGIMFNLFRTSVLIFPICRKSFLAI